MVNFMKDSLNLESENIIQEKNKILPGTLYLVATPIGNLADLSDRAKKVLSGVTFVAAEDTRNTGKLLSCFGIKTPLVSYYEHNKKERGEQIVSRLKNGESCALVTDAGTPAISDPGEDLVKLCAENGVCVTSVPGCCAAVNALTLSALTTRRFVFEGFLEGNAQARTKRLEELKNEKRTVIYYESPHALKDTLALMYKILGDRKISLCREMTKLNEEIMRTTISGAVEYYSEHQPRGEYVLVVEGKQNEDNFWTDMSVVDHVNHYILLGMDRMDAIKQTSKDRGVGKSVIYKEMINNG